MNAELANLIRSRVTIDPVRGCWLWIGSRNRGHGALKRGGRSMGAHRASWEAFRGPIPAGMWVMHSCDVRHCVNPDHLSLGTVVENSADCAARGRAGRYADIIHPAPLPRVIRPVATAKGLKQPSRDYLRSILHYEPLTGELRWKARADREQSWNTKHAGKIAGSFSGNGYGQIIVDKQILASHRVAWAWMTGEWPALQIDHINRNRADNRWSNLRLVNQQQNSANQGLRTNNVSGVRGVSWDAVKRSWFAKITVDYRQIPLGRFKSLDGAIAARTAAEARYFGVSSPGFPPAWRCHVVRNCGDFAGKAA